MDEDYLILSIIHSAKEQEWRSVFVLNVVDGCIPSDLATGSDAEIEEERRLLYVAMTRARDVLHLIVPQRFFTHGQSSYGDRHIDAARTHFIPDNLLGLFDCTAWPAAAAEPATARPPNQGVRVDVGGRLRSIWRRRQGLTVSHVASGSRDQAENVYLNARGTSQATSAV